MVLFKSSCAVKLVASMMVVALICIFPECGGDHPPAKATGIYVSPRNAEAWSNSAESQVVYKVVVGYSDGHDVPLTSGLTWSVDQPWVFFDAPTATATCEYPAPQMPFFGPQPADITAAATVEGQNFTDTVFIDCF